MLKRAFGSTGVSVSVIGFGGAAVSGEGGGYGFGDISESDALKLLHAAFDRGINLFDTAPIYGFGMSERRIGKAFADRREDVFLVSKSGVTWHENKRVDMTNDPEVTERMLEQSLRDLNTDYIDLYMVHWPDQSVDIRKPMEVMARAKKAGKIKFIGLCNSFPEDVRKAMEVDRVDVLQNEFNFFERRVEAELFPLVRDEHLGFMSYGTLDKGILTGRVKPGRAFDQSDARSHAPWWKGADREPKYRAMERIMPRLKEAGMSGLDLALGYVLSRPEVNTALCGMRSIEQLDSAVAALERQPSPDLMKELTDIAFEELRR